MILEPVPCSQKSCRYFQGVLQSDGTEKSEVLVCLVFPKGIPAEISSGKNMHLEPYPGDHGIQYEREEP